MSYQVLVQGEAEGAVLVLDDPLSMWGGLDPATGRIIDASHPQLGESVAGLIVAMPSGRGSSSASTVLAEAMRCGTAPAALILSEPDPILVIGSLVGSLLYDVACPILVGPIPESSAVRIEGPIVKSQ